MKSIVLRCLGLFAFLVFAGSNAYAGDASLTICNKGSVEVDVVVALKTDWLVAASLQVQAWFSISPGDCQIVYDEGGVDEDGGHPAYIGFAVTDSQKHITARHLDQLPDFGRYGRFRSGQVLTRSDRRLCVREGKTVYTINKDQDIDCASFHSGANDPGGYFPIATALYFMPVPTVCSSVGFIGQVSCTGGKYYLNVKPTAGDRELHASAGSENGKDAAPAESSLGDQLTKELGKAAAEQRKRREEMQAEEAVQEKARAGASVRQNVCISDDLTTEWRNPPAGGKMENLKRLLIQSLRDRAKTPGYDQTRWMVVDSRNYSAWPNTSWGNLVSTIPGGSCAAAGHREILELAP